MIVVNWFLFEYVAAGDSIEIDAPGWIWNIFGEELLGCFQDDDLCELIDDGELIKIRNPVWVWNVLHDDLLVIVSNWLFFQYVIRLKVMVNIGFEMHFAMISWWLLQEHWLYCLVFAPSISLVVNKLRLML